MVATNEIFKNLGIKVDGNIPDKRVSREVSRAIQEAKTRGQNPDEIGSVLIQASIEAHRNGRKKLINPEKGVLGRLIRATKEDYKRATFEKNRLK